VHCLSPAAIPPPAPEAVDRFRRDFEPLAGPASRIGVAVSGGPDSLALLLLASAGYGNRVFAATVDHGLRPEAAAEARYMAGIAAVLGVPHAILTVDWPGGKPETGLQEAARDARYDALFRWCEEQALDALLTAHHADDQAETLLMRLGRGAGLPGLAGIRPVQALPNLRIVRPLLGWRRDELLRICVDAGIDPILDPSNSDPRHERTRIRRLLAGGDALDPRKVALSADHLFDVEEAMAWIAAEAIRGRARIEPDQATFDADGLPREIKRRALAFILAHFGADPRGSAVDRVLTQLEGGLPATLAGLRLRPGERWSIVRAPPRRGK
jgi:tRNA(Ile)-lysidine synthase